MTETEFPTTQMAVQLVGPGELALNREKPVHQPGPHQVLAKVEAVGLCFSDMKLLKQFDQHVRKSEVVAGLEKDVLEAIPTYVPGSKPTVPGHEVVCRVVAIGENVQHFKVGERCMVQADFRDMKTAGSNGAFGYNFEGGLQEYVLVDERVVVEKSGQRLLIPVQEDLPASAVALVEPWACVEDSYVNEERTTPLAGGKMAVVISKGEQAQGVEESYTSGAPANIVHLYHPTLEQIAELADEGFDDIVYFGSSKAEIDVLNDKLTKSGIINVVLCGKTIGEPIELGVGRVHYGMTRWIGTTGNSAAESYAMIPKTGELRDGDSLVVIGAGGPMGQMHVIRAVSSGIAGLKVVGTDMDTARLDALGGKANPMAQANSIELRLVNTKETPLEEKFSYYALMAPVAQLVADAVRDSEPNGLVNIFAGIPAPVKHAVDVDELIAKKIFLFGTSGSVIRDMMIVLEKVTENRLDTNSSVDAVSGMAGATDGLAAVENRTLAGKIVVYPQLHDLPLTPLAELGEKYPTVAEKLVDGKWTKDAEAELLRVGG